MSRCMGMRHTAACHRNTAPQKQPYASRYAASHKHVFRCDVYQCLVFQASTYRASFCMTSFSGTSKKSPTSMSRCMGHAYTSHDKPTSRQRSYDERYAAPHWHFWSYLLMEEMRYIAHTPSPYRLLAAVCYAQRAGEDRLEQDLLSQWPCAWHGLPFCQQSLVMRRSSHKRALVWCQASR